MKKICLISYYFKPYRGVGAFRLSYWYDRLKEDGFDVTVFSATICGKSADPYIIRLPERSKVLFFVKDKSLLWGIDYRKKIKDYLSENEETVFLITGGPFLHILPIITLKRKYKKSRWIIDYRDPLARNPVNNSKDLFGKFKYFVKYIYEKIINSYADEIITVNEVCKNLVLSNKVCVIDNGFDERCFSLYREKINSNKLVYAGKTNSFRSLNSLIDVMYKLPVTYSFEYIGPDKLPKTSDRIVSHGFCNYKDTIEILKKSTIGVVLATGKSFESTTKVFDYFAAELKILIITCGNPKTGTLYEITKNNPNVEWAKNTPDEIMSAIMKLERPYQSWDYHIYSRAYGYNRLKRLMDNML